MGPGLVICFDAHPCRIAHVLLPKLESSPSAPEPASGERRRRRRRLHGPSPEQQYGDLRATEAKDIAGLDITVDDMWLAGIMDIRKSPACSLGNFEPLRPVKKCTRIIVPVVKPVV
uniref:Uncharacterized protein n=1 Tax=Oryza meridionalis TaxID=40149 RepID=A0A0E0CFS4_9ORYZ